MRALTLSRYFAVRFFIAVMAVFLGIFALVELVDYIDLIRKAAGLPMALPSERFSAALNNWLT
jgi:lipopolysaccharide export system permease protein